MLGAWIVKSMINYKQPWKPGLFVAFTRRTVYLTVSVFICWRSDIWYSVQCVCIYIYILYIYILCKRLLWCWLQLQIFPGIRSLPLPFSRLYQSCSAGPTAPLNLFANCYGNSPWLWVKWVTVSTPQSTRFNALNQKFSHKSAPCGRFKRFPSSTCLRSFLRSCTSSPDQRISVQRLRYIRYLGHPRTHTPPLWLPRT